MEQYVYKDHKKLRCGYTTGSCAAAAAKAAVMMLLGANHLKQVMLMTPKGIELRLNIEDCVQKEGAVKCAVRKDGGDDIDATNGILIYAEATCIDKKEVVIKGGRGVGVVTKPGLDQPPGEAAINSVPRKMIQEAVWEACKKMDYAGGIQIIVEVPKGEAVAEKTFNKRLGIEGGISILGTSGIVEPMSEKALIDTIKVEMKMKRAAGLENILMTPGNYGLAYVKGNTNLSYTNAVKISNFFGESLDMAIDFGFKRILIIGHIGKLIKLGAGIMNTHSKSADGRMEVFAAAAVEADLDLMCIRQILRCNTTDEVVEVLKRENALEAVMHRVIERVYYHVSNRVHNQAEIGILIFSNKYGLLGKTQNADAMLTVPY